MGQACFISQPLKTLLMQVPSTQHVIAQHLMYAPTLCSVMETDT